MGGSVYRGYINTPTPCIEYNVLMSIETSNTLFNTLSEVTLLPVDCCYDIIIKDADYQYFLNINNAASKLLIELYNTWHFDYVGGSRKFDPKTSSTILFDLVVPMYFLHKDYFSTEVGNLMIDSEGKTKIIPGEKIKIVTKALKKEEIVEDFIKVIEG